MHLECRGMYISAITTLVGREEAEADALFTLASDWSDTTAKSELVSNRGQRSRRARTCRVHMSRMRSQSVEFMGSGH